MSIAYGGDKIVATDGGSLNPLSAIFRNRLIDAGFIINQRGYVSNTALSSGAYAHDRWKAGASGCTYTFTQGSAGVPITITITAGSLQQVIEGANMPEGGTYTLSWEGTAQARFNGGTYGSSPLAITGIVAGANTTIEFNTGTLLKPQVEVGSQNTTWEFRSIGQELALCQRYYQRFGGNLYSSYANGFGESGGANATFNIVFPIQMRAAPTLVLSGAHRILPGAGSLSNNTIAYSQIGNSSGYFGLNTSGVTYGFSYLIGANNDANANLNASAEL